MRKTFTRNSFPYFTPVRLFVVIIAYNSVLISIWLRRVEPFDPASMSSDPWFSLGLGCGLGLLYSVSSYLTYRLGQHREGVRFIRIILGGMSIRLFGFLGLFTLIFAELPVQKPVFLCSFLLVFLIGMAVELRMVYRSRILL